MSDLPYYREQYSKDFLDDPDLNGKALERAHDIRKFEIDLYWKRATYFWTLIAATLVGFVAVQTSDDVSIKADMSVLLACLGIVFSFGWLCVNHGSKFWQETWEFHVDMLENAINGPLYKVVISRGKPANFKGKLSRLLIGPIKISVSAINILTSLFVTVMWVYLLLCYALPPFKSEAPFSYKYAALIALTVGTCVGFLWFGARPTGDHSRRATIRLRSLESDPSSSDM